MRTPQDLPRRSRAIPRNRIGLAVVAAILFVLLTSLRGIAGFYTDFLWFDSLHFASVWRTLLGTKSLLFGLFVATFFVLAYANLLIVEKLAPKAKLSGPEDEVVARYRETVGAHSRKVRLALSVVFALLASGGVTAQWEHFLLFRHAQSFGIKDPQFHKDVGFYVFKLPFLSFLAQWFLVALVIVTVLTVVSHYLNGGIRVQTPGQRVSAHVKAHVSVLLALIALVKAVGYYLQRFELNFSTRGRVEGATYTDIHAQLPAINLLIVISLVAVVLLLVNIRQKGWMLPALAVGLWALVSVAVGAAYPAFIQAVKVDPSELSRERPYIARNIEATKTALGLANVTTREYPYNEALTNSDLADNAKVISNIRLWDPNPNITKLTYQKLQEVKGFYRFNDVDIDRYNINGTTTQALVSVREILSSDLPSKSWVSRHLQFTHGYGAVVAPANAVQGDGDPVFTLKDIPPTGTPEIKQPRIYFGEQSDNFAIVNTSQPEIDFLDASGNPQTFRYDGSGGVALKSFARKAAFFLRFGDVNTMISGQVTSKSRILYVRNIQDRVRLAAPFLQYDNDPYAVVLNDRVVWVQDAYTTSSHFPYAQNADVSGLAGTKSGLSSHFNYVRNSVKVVIDSYDGSMKFYVWDQTDPIIRAYMAAFPALFTTDAIPADLQAHLRYPEDLFKVQTTMFGRYHIDNPDAWYSGGDAWNVAQNPTSAAAPTGATVGQAVIPRNSQNRIDPTYLFTKLPQETTEEFLILRPFVPISKDDKQLNLTAFMTAKIVPGNKSVIELFRMPAGSSISGPGLVNNALKGKTEISTFFTQVGQQGSTILVGNTLLIPIEKSILYVVPLYVQAQGETASPKLRKVVVVYGTQAEFGDTLKEAMLKLFPGANITTLENKGGTGTVPIGPTQPTEPTGPTTTIQASGDTASLLAQAVTLYDQAQAALRSGDLEAYARLQKEAEAKVRQASGQTPTTTTVPPTTTTTAPSSA